MSWSSENTPETCGGQATPAPAETAGSESEEASDEDASAGIVLAAPLLCAVLL